MAESAGAVRVVSNQRRAMTACPSGAGYLRPVGNPDPFLLRATASEACREPHHGACHWTIAVAPRNVLDYNPVLGTLHSPWRVAKMDRDSPQGANSQRRWGKQS